MNYYLAEIKINDAKSIIIENNLNFDSSVDYTIGLFKDKTLIGTGSLLKNVIKLVAIKKDYQGENLLAIIVTNLIKELTKRKIVKYFVFTDLESAPYFQSLGFSLIAKTNEVAFFENSLFPIQETLKEISENLSLKAGSTAAVVVNCNPLTNGHLYLIEKASKENANLLVFVVEENKSLFAFEERFSLVVEATKHLSNVHVLPSTKYLISSLTFPTYFLKDLTSQAKVQMELDTVIFNNYFIPIFKIDKRYVGSEEVDPFTSSYNEILKKYLKEKLIIVKRLKVNNQIVSASLVRKFYQEKNFEKLKPLVPTATYNFLKRKATINK
ncbi:MAG: [citrate (pro-3S)-lyase] ligase [Acholeplasmataceae bacterium]|jgi:[citrate (pro-3S)-lyase] ligase|nr:[citrate (pro-3S)-lyase] ligase [Acholeplasmataceae bacterium]